MVKYTYRNPNRYQQLLFHLYTFVIANSKFVHQMRTNGIIIVGTIFFVNFQNRNGGVTHLCRMCVAVMKTLTFKTVPESEFFDFRAYRLLTIVSRKLKITTLIRCFSTKSTLFRKPIDFWEIPSLLRQTQKSASQNCIGQELLIKILFDDTSLFPKQSCKSKTSSYKLAILWYSYSYVRTRTYTIVCVYLYALRCAKVKMKKIKNKGL